MDAALVIFFTIHFILFRQKGKFPAFFCGWVDDRFVLTNYQIHRTPLLFHKNSISAIFSLNIFYFFINAQIFLATTRRIGILLIIFLISYFSSSSNRSLYSKIPQYNPSILFLKKSKLSRKMAAYVSTIFFYHY